MNNVVKLKQPEVVLDEASTWLAKLDRGLSEEEQLALQHWMSQSKEHETTFLHMAKLWDKMDALSRLADIFPASSAVLSRSVLSREEKASTALSREEQSRTALSREERNSKAQSDTAQLKTTQAKTAQAKQTQSKTPQFGTTQSAPPENSPLENSPPDNSHTAQTARSSFYSVSRQFTGKYAAAASVLFACLLSIGGAYHYLDTAASREHLANANHVQFESELRTRVGESITQTLADGSILTLNTNSHVKVTFTQTQRLLALEYGELHIDVAHNPNQPLSVHAGGKVMQAVGTAFNVEYHNNQVELLVTEGEVRVANIDHTSKASDPMRVTRLDQVRLPRSALSLVRGEKSLLGSPENALTENAIKVVKVKQSDIDAALSWQQGKLIFRGETLQQAMKEVSRYTAVTFDIRDAELAQTHIAGVFNTHDIDALLGALQQNFNIHFEKQGTQKVILKKRS